MTPASGADSRRNRITLTIAIQSASPGSRRTRPASGSTMPISSATQPSQAGRRPCAGSRAPRRDAERSSRPGTRPKVAVQDGDRLRDVGGTCRRCRRPRTGAKSRSRQRDEHDSAGEADRRQPAVSPSAPRSVLSSDPRNQTSGTSESAPRIAPMHWSLVDLPERDDLCGRIVAVDRIVSVTITDATTSATASNPARGAKRAQLPETMRCLLRENLMWFGGGPRAPSISA